MKPLRSQPNVFMGLHRSEDLPSRTINHFQMAESSKDKDGGRDRIRTCDFHRVRVGSHWTAAHSKEFKGRKNRHKPVFQTGFGINLVSTVNQYQWTADLGGFIRDSFPRGEVESCLFGPLYAVQQIFDILWYIHN